MVSNNRFLSVIIFFFLLQFTATNTLALTQNENEETVNEVYQKLKTIPQNAQQVTVGFYSQNIYELDPASNTYYMDFYVWFKWRGSIDPTAAVEFMNGVEDWGMTKVNEYETPKQFPDGNSKTSQSLICIILTKQTSDYLLQPVKIQVFRR